MQEDICDLLDVFAIGRLRLSAAVHGLELVAVEEV